MLRSCPDLININAPDTSSPDCLNFDICARGKNPMVMTSSLNIPEAFQPASALRPEAAALAPVAIPGALIANAVNVRARRGQTVSLDLEGNETVFVVRSGTLMLHVTLPHGLRQVIALLYPGDVFRSAFAPPDAGALLSAVRPGEVLRFRWNAFAELAATDPEITRFMANAVAKQNARQAIHMAAVGRLDCQQRVVTFLLELALRTGTPAPCGGLGFDMPLNRTDMADYLGLNADTLSRTMSRLRSSGLLSHPERQRAFVRSLHELADLTPAARSLMALHGQALPGQTKAEASPATA
jgi:CRP-like cAMP-binding protein